jgi:lipid-A-disaccharide synthase
LVFFLEVGIKKFFNNIPIITQLIKNLNKIENFNFHFFITREFEDLIKNSFANEKYQFYLNNHEYYACLSKLDFAFACSGTVHLELSFSHIPHFIFYKANWFNYLIFKIFVRSKYLSLINIFNKRSIIKEFIQSNFNNYFLIIEFEHLLKNKDKFYDYFNLMIEALDKSNISRIRSDLIIDYLKKSSLTKED